MVNGFHWHLDGLDGQRFSALANLLSIRQGKQVELLPLDDVQPDSGGDRKLKMRFLDRFAELVSCEPGSEHVSCAMLREGEGGAEIWVARNDGIARYADTVFFLQFEGLMSEVRRSEEARRDLWTTMLRYYRPRLIHYIQKLKDSDPSLHSALSDIHKEASRRSTWTDASFSDIIDQAVKLTLQHGANGKQVFSSGWKYVEFLARVRRAHHTFIKCAKKFLKFRSLRIVPVQNEVNSSLPEDLWNLDGVLDYLGLSATNWTATAYIAPRGRNLNRKSSIQWARDRFSLQSKTGLFVHAEVRMVLRILQLALPMEQFFSYMGCSKDNCFLCSTFLKQFGGLTTRGAHSYVYNLWAVPDTPGLSTEAAEKLAEAIKNMENQMVTELQKPTNSRLSCVTETTVGRASSGSSAITEATVPPPLHAHPSNNFELSAVAEEEEPIDGVENGTLGRHELPTTEPAPALQQEAPNDPYIDDRPPSPEPDVNVEQSVVDDESAGDGGGGGCEGAEEEGEICEEGSSGESMPASPLTDYEAHDDKLKSSTPPMDKLFPVTRRPISPVSSAATPSSRASSRHPRSLIPVPTPSIISANRKHALDSASVHSSSSFFKASRGQPSHFVQSYPLQPWQRIHAYLADTVAVMPASLFRKSTEKYDNGSTLDELALSIWSLQAYKRYLRTRDLEVASRPTRLFVSPNAAQAIESALMNGYQASACEMLGKIWMMAGGSANTGPEHVVILMRKDSHWVVHCMDLVLGRVASFGTYYDSEWTKHQSRAWWPALQTLWPLKLVKTDSGCSLESRVIYHHQRDPPEGNSVAVAAIWYKILMGIPIQRSIDLGRLKDLIRREVVSIAQRKQTGDLRASG